LAFARADAHCALANHDLAFFQITTAAGWKVQGTPLFSALFEHV
jgi:hypothetical protein